MVALTVALLLSNSARAQLVRTGYTSVVVASTGKCLDISGQSNTPGAAAVQWHCNNQANEQFNIQPFNGSFRVIVEQNGQCLAVAGSSTGASAQIVQTTCTGASSELWTFPAVGNGVQLRNQNSGLCANVAGNSTADAANIVQSACSNASNFVWAFYSGLVTPSASSVLQANHSGQCLNVTAHSTSAGANIVQWPCSGGTNEQWGLVPSGSAYQVIARNSNMCLAVSGSSNAQNANIVQDVCSTTPNRLWALKPVGRAYQLVAQNSGLCATVSGASQTNATQIVQTTCGTSQNQLWSFSGATLPSAWSGVTNVPVNPVGVANLPSGRLMMWSTYSPNNFQGDIGATNSQTYTSVYDPANGSASQILVGQTGADFFCPGTTMLPDGRVLINGGSSSSKTSIYTPSTANWASSGLMNIARGYQGNTLLSNGTVLTLGGSWSGGAPSKDAEIWSNGTWRRLTGVTAGPFTGPDPQGVYRGDNHLWLFAVGGGQVFHAGPTAAMHWISTTGNGAVTSAGNRGDDPYAINGTAQLYDIGMIMKTGGAPAYQDTDASKSTYTIKITAGVAVTKLAPMAYARAFANGVVLPNGQVVIVGGQTRPVPFSDATAILVPEIWDPQTKVFRRLRAMQVPRVYHSTAILLPDGRVLAGGGGQCGSCTTNHFNTEILTPPYLLNSDGSAASRPSITGAPTTAALGSNIGVTTNTPVMSFVLMRLSVTTHTVNNDQRRIPLQIQSTSGASSYTLSIPADPGTVLPGYYMLFAQNAQGVPSVAATLRIN